MYDYKTLHEESVSAVTATPSAQLGDRRILGLNEYVYVYNSGNSAVGPGYAMVASAMSQGSGTISSLAGEWPLGVVRHSTITTSAYGWIVCRGPTNIYSTTGISSGVAVQLGANGVFATYTAGTAVSALPCGFALGSVATAGTGVCQLMAL